MPDYIIVGFGLAGASLAHHLENNKQSFVVYEDQSQQSSRVAGGLYNPVVLKRFSLAWEAQKQIEALTPFYRSLEKKLIIKIQKDLPIHRKFHSTEEQNNWFQAADKRGLRNYLNPKLIEKHHSIPAEHQFGVVDKTGIVDLKTLLDSYSRYLNGKGMFVNESFDYDKLKIKQASVEYKNIRAKQVVFCEGFGLKKNPFFSNLPLNGTKGEFILIKAPELKLKEAIKSSIFIIPQGKDLYKVGATYNWKDKTAGITESAKRELEKKLRELVSCDFEIIGQSAGIRPTVVDRRPLVGRHSEHPRLYVCNGLGSRGVMIAPTVSQQLIEFIEENKPLPKEIDIARFEK